MTIQSRASRSTYCRTKLHFKFCECSLLFLAPHTSFLALLSAFYLPLSPTAPPSSNSVFFTPYPSSLLQHRAYPLFIDSLLRTPSHSSIYPPPFHLRTPFLHHSPPSHNPLTPPPQPFPLNIISPSSPYLHQHASAVPSLHHSHTILTPTQSHPTPSACVLTVQHCHYSIYFSCAPCTIHVKIALVYRVPGCFFSLLAFLAICAAFDSLLQVLV